MLRKRTDGRNEYLIGYFGRGTGFGCGEGVAEKGFRDWLAELVD